MFVHIRCIYINLVECNVRNCFICYFDVVMQVSTAEFLGFLLVVLRAILNYTLRVKNRQFKEDTVHAITIYM